MPLDETAAVIGGGDGVTASKVPEVRTTDLTPEQLAYRISENVKKLSGHSVVAFQTAMRIGLDLIQASDTVQKGKWAEWLRTQLGMTRLTANRYKAVAKWVQPIIVDGQLDSVRIELSAAYLLTGNKTSDEARTEALRLATNRETVTLKLAEDLIRKFRKPPPEPPEPQGEPTTGERTGDQNYLDGLSACILRDRVTKITGLIELPLDLDGAMRRLATDQRVAVQMEVKRFTEWSTDVGNRLDQLLDHA